MLNGLMVCWRLSNSISEACFLSPEDRKKAVEHVRTNNTGTKSTSEFKWRQALEALIEPKTWLFFAMTLCVNFGASVTLIFGMLILNGIGFDKFCTSLLDMSFGIFQSSPSSLAWLVILYVLPCPNEAGLLAGYYLLAFLYGANPLIVLWISANAASRCRNIIGGLQQVPNL
ncbi:hypothetical protein B0H10DRAFT_2166205 [Mycena sp. CBHHK59/15]|nr:hypothetical protein B0H10DRAFT_2166205 [Mycena sp. CBHHK59/15]